MVAFIVLASLFAYAALCAAIWERTRLSPLQCAARHDTPYHSLNACAQHSYWLPECEACAVKSHRGCGPCNIRLLWIAIWPVLTPLWVGVRIGQRKPVFGIRLRKAERVAKRIADLERELRIND